MNDSRAGGMIKSPAFDGKLRLSQQDTLALFEPLVPAPANPGTPGTLAAMRCLALRNSTSLSQQLKVITQVTFWGPWACVRIKIQISSVQGGHPEAQQGFRDCQRDDARSLKTLAKREDPPWPQTGKSSGNAP